MISYSNPQPSTSSINCIFDNKKLSFFNFKISDVPIGMFRGGSLTAFGLGAALFLSVDIGS